LDQALTPPDLFTEESGVKNTNKIQTYLHHHAKRIHPNLHMFINLQWQMHKHFT